MSVLTLEVGQSYRTRSGKRVNIKSVVKLNNDLYKGERYMGTDNCAYDIHGTPLPPLYTSSKLACGQEPLVAKYHHVAGKPMIKVGGLYPSEAGLLVKITQTVFLTRNGDFDALEVYIGDNKSLYTQYGHLIPRSLSRNGLCDEVIADLILSKTVESDTAKTEALVKN